MAEIANMLILSTAHLSETTARDMTPGEHYCIMERDEGFLLYVPDAEQSIHNDPPPLEVSKALAYARNRACAYVMFDNAVETIDDLPVFDW